MPGFRIQIRDIDRSLFRVFAQGRVEEVAAIWKEPWKAVRSLSQGRVEFGHWCSAAAPGRDTQETAILIGRKHDDARLLQEPPPPSLALSLRQPLGNRTQNQSGALDGRLTIGMTHDLGCNGRFVGIVYSRHARISPARARRYMPLRSRSSQTASGAFTYTSIKSPICCRTSSRAAR